MSNLPKAVNPKFLIGDVVRVINSGDRYTTYTGAAKDCGLDVSKYERSGRNYADIQGVEGTVVGLCRHNHTESGNLYGIVAGDYCYVVGEAGLQVIERVQPVEQDDLQALVDDLKAENVRLNSLLYTANRKLAFIAKTLEG